ncbi:hypothetical protein FSOLCH5_012050 [Fusarium solani]|uniref:Uncharacterized protein n=1 Tax=Fusarium solani TaxID=169388 RepID=A0A9P9GY22_FUSSL|nr:uncharacterized protein B0J15DRAFT_74470 [Fusarium solani]KAH7246804.1 hypothetical protein B0J15DRAFT_74470 [Fusarium solani]KAJ3457480.1 hypothetical protein MRS44_014621 [Fusarium solani]KAJ4216788.1 hypothetical protein NW759_009357 [Fusarium solani]
MGNFGATVASLLDTYTDCLSLLKRFRSNRHEAAASETRSELSSSLRSDRARIRRAYSSRLSQNGARFEKGDAPARSALRRIVKKLTTALANVVHALGGHEHQPVDYESLMALSNGSSLDAIRAMNDLSSRVGSTVSSRSRGSVVSRGRQKSRRNDQQREIRSQKGSGGRSKRDKTRSRKSATATASRRGMRSADRHRQQTPGAERTPEAPGDRNRISIVTRSSVSTKLGEVRRRGSRQGHGDQDVWRTAYLPRSPHAEEVQGRKKWWNPFRGSF